MPPRMRLPSLVLRTSSICVPSSTPSPAGVRRTANGVHNPLTTRRKPKSTTSFPLKNVSDRLNTTKPKTSTVSPLSPADENLLPNRSVNFAMQPALCGNIRPSNFVHPLDYSMKKNSAPCTQPESPAITATSKQLLPISPHSYTRAEAGHSRRRPPGRNGYLLRWHHRHGRNNGTTY